MCSSIFSWTIIPWKMYEQQLYIPNADMPLSSKLKKAKLDIRVFHRTATITKLIWASSIHDDTNLCCTPISDKWHSFLLSALAFQITWIIHCKSFVCTVLTITPHYLLKLSGLHCLILHFVNTQCSFNWDKIPL